jgi:threonine dehydrogenase-like Zn-dependent dehydrogenase
VRPFGQPQHSVHGIPQKTPSPVHIVVHVSQQFILISDLSSYVDRQRLQHTDLVSQLVGHSVIFILNLVGSLGQGLVVIPRVGPPHCERCQFRGYVECLIFLAQTLSLAALYKMNHARLNFFNVFMRLTK